MSIYICPLCGKTKDNDQNPCTETVDGLVCEECMIESDAAQLNEELDDLYSG